MKGKNESYSFYCESIGCKNTIEKYSCDMKTHNYCDECLIRLGLSEEKKDESKDASR